MIEGPPVRPEVQAAVAIAATSDGGQSWILTPIAPENDFFLNIYAGHANLSFVTAERGFALFQMVSSSASSSAQLYGTEDGGRTWKEVSHPDYGIVRFQTWYTGWLVGGVRGDHTLYKTLDGGVNWTEKVVPLPPDVQDKWAIVFGQPSFSDLQNGTLNGSYDAVAKTGRGTVSMTAHYLTEDGGDNWKLEYFSPTDDPVLNIETLDRSAPPKLSLEGNQISLASPRGVHQSDKATSFL